MTNPTREVAVLGSARINSPDERWDEARKLGGLLAGAGFVVVTGGYGGLMAAVSQGANESGGHVVGLPMRGWDKLEPNPWNAELRWAEGYGARLDHILKTFAVVALPGGIGTLSELAVIWAAAQTEPDPPAILLVGKSWAPVLEAIRENLVVGEADMDLLCQVGRAEDVIAVLSDPARRLRPGRPRG